MKLIVYIMVLVMFLPIVSPNGDFDVGCILFGGCGETFELVSECSGARFCGDSNLECSYVSDGVCPTNYGDWSGCRENNYGGDCTPCDSDCVNCGQDVSMNVPGVEWPGGGNINIYVNALGYDGEEEYIYELREVDGEGVPSENLMDRIDITCQDYGCSHIFVIDTGILEFLVLNEFSELKPCGIYKFQLKFCQGNCDNPISVVYDTGMVSSYIEITNPNQDDVLEGSVMIQATTECDGGNIEEIDYYICEGEDCNLITYLEGGESSYNWDTTKYFNRDYILGAIIIGEKEGNWEWYVADGLDITINNPPGSTYSGSKLLNLLVVKVKSWI